MAYSYTELQAIKGRIVGQLSGEQAKITALTGQANAIKTILTGMQTTYGGWVTEVNDFLAANPADPAALALKAEADLIVAEFVSAKALCTSLHDAIDAVVNPPA